MRFIYSLIVHQSIIHIATGSVNSPACLETVAKKKASVQQLMDLPSFQVDTSIHKENERSDTIREKLFAAVGDFMYAMNLACSDKDILQKEYGQLLGELGEYWGDVQKRRELAYIDDVRRKVKEAVLENHSAQNINILIIIPGKIGLAEFGNPEWMRNQIEEIRKATLH
jgi:hypothetical protein